MPQQNPVSPAPKASSFTVADVHPSPVSQITAASDIVTENTPDTQVTNYSLNMSPLKTALINKQENTMGQSIHFCNYKLIRFNDWKIVVV